ncbi:MAG: hypothetical protein ACU84H_07055, partial [Gammaproteobacteria bacterium]
IEIQNDRVNTSSKFYFQVFLSAIALTDGAFGLEIYAVCFTWRADIPSGRRVVFPKHTAGGIRSGMVRTSAS